MSTGIYDTNVSPAAPIVTIRVRLNAWETGVELAALIDSGSEQTLLPRSIIQRLNLAPGEDVILESAAGTYQARSFLAIISIDALAPVSLQISELELEDYAILGRDFLNNFFLQTLIHRVWHRVLS